MRRFNICEERGSGIDKVLQEVEVFQLPAPLFESPPGSTRVSLFAHKPLSDMSKSERIRACYLHACLCYVTSRPVNNASIRERFGLSDDHNDRASRLLKEAIDDGVIHVRDLSVGTRSRTICHFGLPDLLARCLQTHAVFTVPNAQSLLKPSSNLLARCLQTPPFSPSQTPDPYSNHPPICLHVACKLRRFHRPKRPNPYSNHPPICLHVACKLRRFHRPNAQSLLKPSSNLLARCLQNQTFRL